MIKKQYSKTKPVCKVTFTLPLTAAPEAQEVKVLGDFNNWSWENGLAMKAGKTEYSADIELAAGQTYQFRYMIDRVWWENDHAADNYVPSGIAGVENSVLALEAAPAPAAKAPAKQPSPAAKSAPAKKASPAPAAKAKAAAKPKSSTKPAAGTSADLTKIEGIGPKIAQLLQQGGIATFEALAKAKKAELKKILDAAGTRYQMHDPTTWPQQAKLAANGDWDKLATLQKELKGGKKA
jgi:predicted flap endonuclease-1-like 5' DNA nuclease